MSYLAIDLWESNSKSTLQMMTRNKERIGEGSRQMTGNNEDRIDSIAATKHELKTSLTAIMVSAELLADELQVDEKSAPGRLIQGIIRNAHAMNESLSHFSEMAGLIAGDLQLQLEPIEIKQVIYSVATRFYPGIRKKRQSLTLELPDSLPPVKADMQCIEKVLLTLVANASKFTPQKGKIKVSAWQSNDSLVVQVSDTGVGIPADEQERIFQPYYQIEREEGESHTNSGLGLAIAKFLVELHGGKMWLQSKVGQGSDFFLSLPLQSTH